MCHLALILIAILSLSEARKCGHGLQSCGRHHHRLRQHNVFEEIADEIIDADKKIQSFCNDNGKHNFKEVYGPDDYRIKIPIQNVNEDSVAVQIKHRVLYVTAIDEEIQSRNPKKEKIEFTKVLPENVITAPPASWYLDDNEFVVMFPYKVKLNEGSVASCETDISSNVVSLSQSDRFVSSKVPFANEEDDLEDNTIP